MSTEMKVAPAATRKPAKKLIPRTAPEADQPAEAPSTEPPAPAVAIPATAAATARARPARQTSREDETVAKCQQALAEALQMAQAIDYEQPPARRQPALKGKKVAKPGKVRKLKLVRDSYAMPEAEHARLGELKKHLSALGSEVKKSELLRAGVALLAALSDPELKAAMARVERIKTGRPAK